MTRIGNTALVLLVLALAIQAGGCRDDTAKTLSTGGEDTQVRTLGSIEVTARLVEIPQGAIVKRDLYNYASILKYEVLTVHRGKVYVNTIYVGQYNPFKPRSEAADRNVTGIGGTVDTFQAGQIHRMALEVPLDDYFMGGIVNKYFGNETGPLYWAVWTNLAQP